MGLFYGVPSMFDLIHRFKGQCIAYGGGTLVSLWSKAVAAAESLPEMTLPQLTINDLIGIGGLLVIDSAGFHTGIELLHMPLEKLIVYFAMVFCIVLELIQMRYNANFLAWRKDRWKNETAAQIDSVRAEIEAFMKGEPGWEEWKRDERMSS